MKRMLFLLMLAVIITSCKKDPETISLSGKVIDPYQNIPVSGVKVTLQANGIVEGVYNSSFVTLGVFTTNAAGEFDFIIDESAYDSFRFTFLKDGYYLEQSVVNAGSISPEEPYDRDYEIFSKAVIKLHLINVTPYDNSDKLTISFTNNPIDELDCCSSVPVAFEGMTIDTTFLCSSVGAYDLILFRSLTKNATTTYQTDTLVTIPCDTLDVEVQY